MQNDLSLSHNAKSGENNYIYRRYLCDFLGTDFNFGF